MWSAITLAAASAALIVVTWRRRPLAEVTGGRLRPRRIRPALLEPGLWGTLTWSEKTADDLEDDAEPKLRE